VHLGRLLGSVGFSRTVAIKRLHPQFAKDPDFVAMFLDEARLATRIRHPNVVPTLDIVALDHELFLVMEYVQGESLARLVRASKRVEATIPLQIVTTIMAGVLHGLHAAHEAKTEQREPLSIVHRDVSPQNVLVGIDGVPRVLDFGVAKAADRVQTTQQGQLKGKVPYMAPEQLRGEQVDRRCDVFAAAAVLWEAVTRTRMLQADNHAALVTMALFQPQVSPRTLVPDLDVNLERIIMRGLQRDPSKRYATAREMALELEACLPVASASSIGNWVERLAHEALAQRARRMTDIERQTSSTGHVAVPALMAAATAPADAPPMEDLPTTVAPSSLPPAVVPKTRGEDVTSVLSQVTVVAPHVRRPRLGRRAIVVVAGAAVVGAVAVLALRGSGPAAGVDAHPATSAEPSAQAAASTPTAPPIASVTAQPAASASAPRSSAGGPTRASPAAPNLPRREARPAVNCTPPFTVDGSGFRHVKPECL
jgi:serine/threonine-protein kinase